jgi:hypothetical protein
MKKKISLIIPSDSENFYVNDYLINISLWSLLPSELIIINTTNKKYFINKITKNILKKKKINLILLNKKKFYPGGARNAGVKISKNKYLVFLDMNTVPYKNDWLEKNFKFFIKNDLDALIGQTYYLANSTKEKIIRASTYGKNFLNTLPGSIIDKRIFEEVGLFNSTIRAGEDIDWLRRLNNNHFKTKKSLFPISYKGLNNVTYLMIIKKWFRNYFSSSNLPHLSLQKNFYIYGLFFFLFFLAYNWNYHLDFEKNQVYIPHITKIFLFISFVIYLTIRGIYIPFKKNISLSFLFPFNFLIITFFSFMLDQVKSLSFFLGVLAKFFYIKR